MVHMKKDFNQPQIHKYIVKGNFQSHYFTFASINSPFICDLILVYQLPCMAFFMAFYQQSVPSKALRLSPSIAFL